MSKTACELIEVSAKQLGGQFEVLADIYVPVLLKLCNRPNKVFMTAADKCVLTIVRHTPSSRLIPLFIDALRSSSKRLRELAIVYIKFSITENVKEDLDRFAADLQSCLKDALTDASESVRSSARECFAVYCETWLDRAKRQAMICL